MQSSWLNNPVEVGTKYQQVCNYLSAYNGIIAAIRLRPRRGQSSN